MKQQIVQFFHTPYLAFYKKKPSNDWAALRLSTCHLPVLDTKPLAVSGLYFTSTSYAK